MSTLGDGDGDFIISIEMTGWDEAISMLPKRRPKGIADIHGLRISRRIDHAHVVRRHNCQTGAISRNELPVVDSPFQPVCGVNARLIRGGELGGPDGQRPGAYSLMLRRSVSHGF